MAAFGNTVAIGHLGPATDEAEEASDFAVMFAVHYRRVVRALELGGLDHASAEDAAEEAFARTLARWRRVRKGTNPPGYAYRIAFRLSRQALARQASTTPLLAEAVALSDPAAEAGSRVDLERALEALPPRRRACAVCCFVVGMSTKEAAAALGIAEGTVRKQLGEARQTILSRLVARS